MNIVLLSFFFFSLFLIVYNYLLYPLIILIASKVKSLKHEMYTNEENFPSVCLVIPAISDYDSIKKKIDNTIKLYYPANKLTILTVSDRENIPVQDLISLYKSDGVLNFKKKGINNYNEALNIAAKLAKSDIIVFSDINNDFNDMVLMQLARHFKDKSIGAVTGVRNLYSDKSIQSSLGEGLYWKYETLIKTAQSKLGSVTAAAGEILAIRRELYKRIDENTINFDSAITFDMVKSGYRVIVDTEAMSLKKSHQDIKDLFMERALKAKGSFQTFFREFTYLLSPNNAFVFNFVSHKVIRWFVPFFLIALFVIPFFMLENTLMLLFLMVQVFFYLYALFGWFMRNKYSLPGYANFITYFAVMNAAMFVGFFKFIVRR